MVLRATRLLVLLCCIGVSLANATPFDLPISFEVDEAQSTVFRVTVHNPSETDTLVIVPFSSPLSMDSSLSFDVIDIEAQSSLSYTGPVFTRVWPPSSESIISISARESHSAVLDLQKGFDLTAGHSYSVQPHLAAKVLGVFLPVDEHQKRHADSSLADVFTATATAGLNLRASPQTRSAPVLLRATASTTPSSLAKAAARDVPCTTSENSTIASAVALGRQQIGWVLNFVNKGCTGTGYTKWFGTVTTPNYAVVKSCVTNIDELINSNYGVDFVVVCGGSECESDTYAYVYPDDTDKHIYVCGAFWEANTGWPENDSTGGTLIHECSHFSDICGTDDHAYGTVACQELAQSNVQQAINNADSYEYFAESKPDICADTTTTTTTTKAGGSTNSQSSTSSASNTAATSSRTSASTTTTSRTSATDTTTSSGGSSGCFAASGSVRVLAHDQTVEIKSLSDIQVGDLVESVDASLKREFSQVYAVLHKESNTEEKIIQLTVEGSSIKLTPHHLLLVSSSSSSDNWQLTDASSVRTGDRLLLITDDGNTVARRVLSIHQLKAAIRAPLTLNDRIVVDGVVASVFAHSESLYSPLCAPLKFIFQHFPNLLASSPAQAALNLIVQWTDTFEARQPFQVSSFAL